ncbi:MAG: COG3650 family protein [Paracoccaceae bacterium]
MRVLPPLALILSLTLAAPASATQEYFLPTLFDVSGVAADDVLNIRAQPNAGATIIGTLAPDATRIEVVEEGRGWGRVSVGEVSGWVSMRYLNYRTDVWEDGKLPASFRCYGTEPFWSMHAEGSDLVYSTPDLGEERRPVSAILSTGIFRDPTRAVVAEGITLTATPQQCSDGMSDRVLGMRAMAVLTGENPQMLTGCCWIQP